MAWWFWWFWVCLWTPAAAQPPFYRLQQNQVTFEQAAAACSPGLLTSLATTQELERVLALIPSSVSPVQADLSFWVGLRKAKNECVVPVLPLRGFKWTSDGSEVTQVSRWAEEPEHTCTTVRCAALKARVDGSAVAEWGLVPVSCRAKHPFICKHKESPGPVTPTVPHLEPTSAEPEPHRPSPTSDTPDSRTESNYPPDSHHGPQQDGGSGTCRHPSSSWARSLILDPNDPGRIQVECWTPDVVVEVRCSGQPARWRLLDGSLANFSGICVLCEDGFHKSSSGTCEDVDECVQPGAPCRSTCLNTLGSYRCVCADQNGELVSEDSPVCQDAAGSSDRGVAAGLLIPLLVAVAALVVMLLLLAVMVKCCVMRRSKRRAAKRAEKMSMDSKDGDKLAA